MRSAAAQGCLRKPLHSLQTSHSGVIMATVRRARKDFPLTVYTIVPAALSKIIVQDSGGGSVLERLHERSTVL